MKRSDVLACSVCKMTVELLNAGSGVPPVCCDQPMQILPEQTAEFKFEKHVPFPQELSGGRILVKVGRDAAHPMTAEHYIQWIEICDGKNTLRHDFAPEDAPEAEFAIPWKKGLIIREFCNLHGLWKYVIP